MWILWKINSAKSYVRTCHGFLLKALCEKNFCHKNLTVMFEYIKYINIVIYTWANTIAYHLTSMKLRIIILLCHTKINEQKYWRYVFPCTASIYHRRSVCNALSCECTWRIKYFNLVKYFVLHVHSRDRVVQTLRRWYIDAV